MRLEICAALLLSLYAAPALAQVSAPVPAVPETCEDPTLGGSLSAWTKPAASAVSASDQAGVKPDTLKIGTRMHLMMAKNVKLLQKTRKDMPKEYVYQALAGFTVPKDGTYRVGIVEGMWVDVFQKGVPVTSTGHGHGPGCEGKHVDFPLKAGAAVLQLDGGPYETADVLIVPLDK